MDTRKIQKEAKAKWGKTKEYKQSLAKTSKYTTNDWKRITKESTEIFKELVMCMNNDNNTHKSNELVIKWKDHITKNYYDCTNEILLGLADIYITDERFKNNINKHGVGLAQFMSKSIKNYCNE